MKETRKENLWVTVCIYLLNPAKESSLKLFFQIFLHLSLFSFSYHRLHLQRIQQKLI